MTATRIKDAGIVTWHLSGEIFHTAGSRKWLKGGSQGAKQEFQAKSSNSEQKSEKFIFKGINAYENQGVHIYDV